MKNLTQATGRRKESIARVAITDGDGQRVVNGRPIREYFGMDQAVLVAEEPLKTYTASDKINVVVQVCGGGKNGQAGAMRLGLARALETLDPSLHKALRDGGFLSRDPRMKERKKYGQPGARKRFQFSKR